MNQVRVVVADDNLVIRSGLVSLLEATGEVLVVGEAGDGRQAVALAERHRPDLVLLDVRMPLMDGVTAVVPLSKITKVLMLTYTDDPEVVRLAVRKGAKGYLVHGTFDADELVAAVRSVAVGEANPLSPAAVTALVAAVRGDEEVEEAPRELRRHGLSVRESEVMGLIAQGRSNREIAAQLFLTEKTVKNHVNRIFAKLGVSNRAAAIAHWLGTAVPDGGAPRSLRDGPYR